MSITKKTNWQTKKLGEVCEIKPPKNEARKKLKDDDLVSFIPMENLGILNKHVFLSKERKLKEVSGSYTYFADGDVLLAKITPCFENGKLGIARNLKNGIGFGSSEYIVFRPKKDLLAEYLFYFLSDDAFRQEGKKNMSGAVGHKRVAKEFIENFEIPLPPLPEQHRIVKILDEVFMDVAKAKENAEKNLQNAKELFESYLQSVFANPENNWEEKILNDVCADILAGGDKPKGAFSKFKTDEFQIPIFSNGKKNDGLYGYTNTARIKKPSITISARGTIGYSVIRREAFFPIIRLIVLTPNDDLIDLDFLHYSITNNSIIGNGTSIPQLTVPAVKKIKISFPKSLKTQKETVKKLDELSDQIKKLETIYQQKLADLEELKKSVLKRAFSGDL